MKTKVLLAITACLVLTLIAVAATPTCTTIQSGTLLYQSGHYLAGQPITTGVNPYGYNYQAHSYNGNFFNVYAGSDNLPPYNGDDAAYSTANPSAVTHWAWPYRTIDVAMKWNDAWISNKDCDGDGRLDRHYGFAGYIGSGAWLTNHNSWTATDTNGQDYNASEFTKIVARPANAVVAAPSDPYWGEQTIYIGGQIMGPQLWGDFAVIQDVLNDKSLGEHGLFVKGQITAGFGKFQP